MSTNVRTSMSLLQLIQDDSLYTLRGHMLKFHQNIFPKDRSWPIKDCRPDGMPQSAFICNTIITSNSLISTPSI